MSNVLSTQNDRILQQTPRKNHEKEKEKKEEKGRK